MEDPNCDRYVLDEDGNPTSEKVPSTMFIPASAGQKKIDFLKSKGWTVIKEQK